ncbi:hypothetical protein CY34DRAFT_803374 [Suillus luteus UH-Slu-Lm8-n1]|uniref:Uncharacterized protein n=1 Tax=Suillus luteus UH-Slu-Lm8-n1 TaxID=930992 RepID=A0A0D0APR0_9AGAM|nr:hypothetical protein CY34DRAFT_803374 [Suillus luteus UH-Slu-Lm8-n1]
MASAASMTMGLKEFSCYLLTSSNSRGGHDFHITQGADEVSNEWRPTSDAIFKDCLLSASFDVVCHLGYHPFYWGHRGLGSVIACFSPSAGTR